MSAFKWRKFLVVCYSIAWNRSRYLNFVSSRHDTPRVSKKANYDTQKMNKKKMDILRSETSRISRTVLCQLDTKVERSSQNLQYFLCSVRTVYALENHVEVGNTHQIVFWLKVVARDTRCIWFGDLFYFLYSLEMREFAATSKYVTGV